VDLPARLPAECVVNPERIHGEGLVASFVLELAEIWE